MGYSCIINVEKQWKVFGILMHRCFPFHVVFFLELFKIYDAFFIQLGLLFLFSSTFMILCQIVQNK